MLVIRRREFIALLGSAAAWPLAAWAQRADQARRIGVLAPEWSASRASALAALREELAKRGWVEGRNLQIDHRTLSGADELAGLRPDVIVAFTGMAAREAQQRAPTVPVVFVGGGDPADNSSERGIARPVGNVTGFANNFLSLGGKWLELLKQAAPHVTRVASVFDPELVNPRGSLRRTIEAVAPQLGIKTISTPIRSPDEIVRAIDAFAAEPGGALLMTGPQRENNLKATLELALQYRLPTMGGLRSWLQQAC
jgi:putative ABC transport system substrate-binding protein